MNSKNAFFNDFGRIRSGWRFLIYLCSFLFVLIFLEAAAFTILTQLPIGFDNNALLFFIARGLIYFLCAVVVGWLCVRFFENLPFRSLGWSLSDKWFKHLIFGLITGAFSILLASLIAFVFGGLQFQANQLAGSSAIWLTLGISLLIFIAGSAAEEALFRGYMLQTFVRADLVLFAVVLTSVLFASVHNANPNASFFSWFNTFLAGILFALGYLKTRTLWFPFALHLMWNWVQGSVLGIRVSGIKEISTPPVFLANDLGPVWLTGGEYGIEGGVACTVSLIVTILLIWLTPILKPTEEMLALTENEMLVNSADKLSSKV